MGKNNIIIRKMNTEDLNYFRTHLNVEFDDFWSYTILESEFNNKNTNYIVAESNGELVGFAGILTIIDEANVMNIVTKKDKRQIGIGSMLLSELIQISILLKMKSVTLEVNEHNIAAIHLYEKFNFEKVGIRKKYYNNTDSAVLMTLYL